MKNVVIVKMVGVLNLLDRIMGMGSKRAISISKTRKITAKRKNRSENGTRADLLGSKPHSNGLDFSRSLDVRAARNFDKIRRRPPNKTLRPKLNKDSNIH